MNKTDGFENKRDLKRHYLMFYLRVFNRDTGEVLGHLVDITTKGVMIMRETPVETGKEYNLRLRWRDAADKLQIADFSGVCRWCHPDVNPDFYGAGFAITIADESHVKAIHSLIEDLGMPSGRIDGIE